MVIASRNEAALKATADELSPLGKVVPLQCNIRDEKEVKSLVKAAGDQLGNINFLVNNGGGQFISDAKDLSMNGWKAVVDLNLNGPFMMAKEVFKQHFEPNGGGSIVNITIENFRGFPKMAHSGAARAGTINWTKSVAVEWASAGVRVNCLSPGYIYSKTAEANYAKGPMPDLFDRTKKDIPAMRCGTVQEISSGVCFLLSPGASFISGTTMEVDGAGRLYTAPLYQVPEHNKIPEYDW